MGISDIRNPLEVKSLQGSALAQKEIGCPILIHTPIWEKKGNAILDILEQGGADLKKVALSHLDPTMADYDYADSLAKRGAYIVYDMFGDYLMSPEGTFLPTDNERIPTLKEQITRGNLRSILISHDICFKICLTKWGGNGYAHILENIVPRLRQKASRRSRSKRSLSRTLSVFLAGSGKRVLSKRCQNQYLELQRAHDTNPRFDRLLASVYN